MNIPKIFVSFLVIIIIAVSGAIFTILKMNDYTTNTQNMYRHPFTVSNETANIENAIITMHRDMKDIVLTKDNVEIIVFIENIKHEEELALTSFKLIHKYYLGDQADIDKVEKMFIEWKPIRDEVIALIYKDKRDEAIHITQNKGKGYIDTLSNDIHKLKEYAYSKAEEYYNQSLKNEGVRDVIIIFILTLVVSSIIVVFVIINLLRIGKANTKQLNLIDQNIMMVHFDYDKKITDISNALCATFEYKKKDILGQIKEDMFLGIEQFKLIDNHIYAGVNIKRDVSIRIGDNEHWFNVEIFPEIGGNLEISGFIMFLNNITDKKNLETFSKIDPLTGLLNRGNFDAQIELALGDARTNNSSFALIMLDIDYFKQYNDTYGHHDGDTTLKKVSQVLLDNAAKDGEFVFRIGGEEFMIISQSKSKSDLEKQIKKILSDIENLNIPHAKSEVSKFVTSSAGGIFFEKVFTENSLDIYKMVDACLYTAKDNGRNQYKIKD